MSETGDDEWLFRFEAADFDSTVFDMPKLSPIRGASLSYLYSPDLVQITLARASGVWGLRTVYTGASQGAWIFRSAGKDAQAAADVVRAALGRDDLASPEPTGVHSHLSYVTALVRGSDAKALSRAETLCNLKKLQGDGFPIPDFDPNAKAFDGSGDRARPANGLAKVDGKAISKAHDARREFGRDQRQRFYARMFSRQGNVRKAAHDFTNDFETLVKGPPLLRSGDGRSSRDLPVSLQSKIGVFFADGNRLNRHRENAGSGSLAALTEFSDRLKADQTRLLASLLDWLETGAANGPDHAFLTPAGELRFETLMWGGDELLFVMPSWLALEFAANFFEWTRGWTTPDGDPITFSAGLVVCDHKIPIRQAKTVALQLADIGKKMQPMPSKDGSVQTRSLLQIEIFESLSLPDVEFGRYRHRLYFPDDPNTADDEIGSVDRVLAIADASWGGMRGLLDRIAGLKKASGLPRSQLYRLLRKASATGFARSRRDAEDEALRAEYEKYRRRAGMDTAPDIERLEVHKPATGSKVPFSLNLALLAMLWDYAAPLEGEE